MKDSDVLEILKNADIEFVEVAPTTTWIDTGSYIFNALLSGSIYKGLPGNRSTMLAGAPSAGKSYLALSAAKQFLIDNKNGVVLYFDTEFALDKEMLEKRNLDSNRFKIIQPETLQDFREKAVKFLDGYEKTKSKTPVMIVLDSLSNLPTKKELEDALSGNEARDMTKAQVIRSIFRIITSKLGKCDIPLIIANHVYSSMDMYSPVVISGGDGAKYAASTIITLTKSKDKDGTDVVGNIINTTAFKSRFTKENKKVHMKLDYNTGLDRYYGLLDIAEKYGIFVKSGTRYEMPDGSKVFGKTINENPEKFYTIEILDRIDEACMKEFSLGMVSIEDIKVEETEE
jgi:RecA/RadA recombinase